MTKYTDRIRQGANIRFGLAALIVIIAAIFLVWPSFKQITQARAGISNADDQIIETELKLEAERNEYRLLKNEYGIDATLDQSTITKILPESAEETAIVRELERKANELSGDNNSLILESVNIGKSSSEKDVDYLSLPIKINLTGTKEKLLAFLRYLEKSGVVVDDQLATRLLDVQDVSMQIKNRGSQTSASSEINVDITANAYILPTPEEIAARKAKQ